jgi:hypothetical protein
MIINTLKALVASLALTTAASAAVEYDPESHKMTITGDTTQYQINAAYAVLKDNEVVTVEMSGPGGNYYAGLSLGRMLKREGVTVIIKEGSTCVSACAFAALGGDRLLVDGALWFHVPYLTGTPTNRTVLEIAQYFGLGYLDMPVYLADVGVTINFANVLMKDTSECKFYVIKDGAEIVKLKNTEKVNSRVVVKHTILNKCK